VKKELIIIVASLLSLSMKAQIHQGEWRDHLSYNIAYRITSVGNLVYCATQSGLLSYDKTTQEVQKHSKVTGLSDVEVSTIEYSNANKVFIVGYLNGNIDLIKDDGTIINLSDLKRKTITGNKTINRIITYGHYAYLACDFGIVVVDLNKEEIKDSYLFGNEGASIKVNDITIFGNSIYAATESGLYLADLGSPNLVDYKYWFQINFLPQPYSAYKFVENFNSKVYAVYSDQTTQRDELITINSNTFENSNLIHDETLLDLSSSNGFICLGGLDRTYIYSQNGNLLMNFTTSNLNHTYVDVDQTIYTASSYTGFSIVQNENNRVSLAVNCPRFREVSKIATLNDQVWVSSGGPNRLYSNGGAYSFFDEKWSSYTSYWGIPFVIGNTYRIAIDPRDNTHVYASAYGYGLIEFRNGQFQKMYTIDNTEVFSNISKTIDIRIAGLRFDQQNNLWMLLDGISQPLFKINADGSWERPKLSSSLLNLSNIYYSDLLVTKAGQIWICTRASQILVLEENGSGGFIENPLFLVKNNGGEIKGKSFCLDEDNQGNVWVGTTSGPIYYDPTHLFTSSSPIGNQYRVPRNDGTNNADFFLAGEVILDIATDGGNRKWLATDKSGVYLISEDGTKVINNFRAENSPLISNSVTGVAINEKSGEVFMATDKGLISYKGTATKGNADFTDVYVYPNPVRPNYEGNITITGLVENTIVKITDVSGNLVFETKSLGGQAIWDGHNFNGTRVSTGVYLVFLSSEDGEKTCFTKLVFIH
jgi:hypothetical protein